MPLILGIWSVSAADHLNDLINEKWAIACGEHHPVHCLYEGVI
jgi:hypothetical protein